MVTLADKVEMSKMKAGGDVPWVDGDPGEGPNLKKDVDLQLLKDIEVDDEEDPVAVSQYVMDPELTSIRAMRDTNRKNKGIIGDIISVKSVASWLATPVVGPWNRYTMAKARRHNHLSIVEYALRVRAFYGEEFMPPAIGTILDAIIENHENGEFKELISTSDDLSSMDYIKRKLTMEAKSTKILRRMLAITLDLMSYLEELILKLKEHVDFYGSIDRGSPDDFLCQSSCEKMLQLVKRLGVLQSVLREQLPLTRKYENVLAAVKLSVSWLFAGQGFLFEQMSASPVGQLEMLYLTTCESIVKMTGSICYFTQVPDLSSHQHFRLFGVATDLTIVLKELRDDIQTIVSLYADSVEALQRDSILAIDVHELRRPGFTREDKVARQCRHLIIWSKKFAEHVELMQNISAQAASLNDDCESEDYKKAMEQLKVLKEKSEKQEEQFQRLMLVHYALLKDLFPKSHALKLDVNAGDKQLQMENVRAAAVQVSSEDFVEENPSQSSVYSNDDTAEATTNDELLLENKDEVYMALFVSNDANNFTTESEYSEENITEQLYSGVMDQLKSALVPLQNKMKLREREAVTKLFGSLQDAGVVVCQDDDSDGLDQQQESDVKTVSDGQVTHVIKPRKGTKKYSTEFDYDEIVPTASTTFSDVDFMKELKEKMNLASSLCFLSEEIGNDLICEPSSLEDTEVEDNQEV